MIASANKTASKIAVQMEDQVEVAEMQQKLRLGLLGAIKEEDVIAIGKRQVEKAMAGDQRSLEFVMKYMLGIGLPVTMTQVNVIDPESAARATKTINSR